MTMCDSEQELLINLLECRERGNNLFRTHVKILNLYPFMNSFGINKYMYCCKRLPSVIRKLLKTFENQMDRCNVCSH